MADDTSKKNLKSYDVTVPFVGQFVITVEAESESDAIDKAMGSEPFDIVTKNGAEVLSCEFLTKITSGNVLHVNFNKAYSNLSFGEDDEDSEGQQ